MQFRIETYSRIKEIQDPVKAREINLVFFSIVQVLNGNGKWCFVGIISHYYHHYTALYVVACINAAIKAKKKSLLVDF